MDTPLSGKQDTEGLAYTGKGTQFWISCKEEPLNKRKGQKKGMREVVLLDLSSMEQMASVWILPKQIAEILNEEKESFKPSAMAVHPRDGRLFILSSKKPALTTLGPDLILEEAHMLDPAYFPQPEGLAFDKKGNLYISSEAAEPVRPASIARFNYRKRSH